MSADLEDAWSALHDATPAGWHVGRPSYHSERRQWVQYALWSERASARRAAEPGVDGCRRDRGSRRAGDGPVPEGDWRGARAAVEPVEACLVSTVEEDVQNDEVVL